MQTPVQRKGPEYLVCWHLTLLHKNCWHCFTLHAIEISAFLFPVTFQHSTTNISSLSTSHSINRGEFKQDPMPCFIYLEQLSDVQCMGASLAACHETYYALLHLVNSYAFASVVCQLLLPVADNRCAPRRRRTMSVFVSPSVSDFVCPTLFVCLTRDMCGSA